MRFYLKFLCLGFFLFNGCFFISPNLGPLAGGGPLPLQEVRLTGEGRAKILLIDISGVLKLETEDRPFFLGSKESPVEAVVKRLQAASHDPNVVAVILRVNSPGGTVTASDILYHEILEFKDQTRIPVIVAMMDVAASGAYYVAMASDKVIAHPTTITGSIGVIMTHISVEGLLQKIGVSGTNIVSGENKDIGTPFKDLSTEDQKILQSVIDSHYQTFVSVVQKGRKTLSEKEVRRLADGRIYTAEQALSAGLIDQIGYLDDAIEEAKKRAGVIQALVVIYTTPDKPRETIYSGIDSRAQYPALLGPLSPLLNLDPNFLYLWLPPGN
ncbi:MAG: signal peptide peptidase SppA [Deltaproteobacteria bacterium]|nr:signal peptide peptidase SppA [Deltaproteobacteria bacterium]